MLLSPFSFHSFSPSSRTLVHLPHGTLSKATIFCSTVEPDKSIPEVPRSSRGKTRKSLGLEPSELYPPRGADDSTNPPNTTKSENGVASIVQSIKNKGLGQQKTAASKVKKSETDDLNDWAKRNEPATNKSSDNHIPNAESTDEMSRKRIQDLINADLEQRYKSDDDDSDDEMPLFVDEEDPYWLDEPDEGWGFKVSDIFKEKFGVYERKKKKGEEDEDVSDIPDTDWDFEPERWSAKDVDSMNWTETVFGDPSPLVVILYDRYGKKGRECYHVLRELEDAANQIWETKRLPPRLARICVSYEEDLTAALRVKQVPTLLFIKGGKLLHQQSGYHTADDFLRIISYFYYGAARPPCLKKCQVPVDVPRK